MATVNKEKALHEWANTNPFFNNQLLFDFLDGHEGSCAISPVYQDAVLKTYIGGTKIRQYTFSLQIMLTVSDSTDNTNVENMFTLRQWQDWITEQEENKNYPDFGANCSDYRLENLNSTPFLALRYENNIAKYQFFARLSYKELN